MIVHDEWWCLLRIIARESVSCHANFTFVWCSFSRHSGNELNVLISSHVANISVDICCLLCGDAPYCHVRLENQSNFSRSCACRMVSISNQSHRCLVGPRLVACLNGSTKSQEHRSSYQHRQTSSDTTRSA